MLENCKGVFSMSVKADSWIKKMALEHEMIKPFADRQVRKGVISYGLSAYGYDMRIGQQFKIFNGKNCDILSAKESPEQNFTEFAGKECVVPPQSFVLGQTVEYFKIPRNIITICFGKSTYARCGIFVNVTPFEPEWEGYATIAISNPTFKPVKIFAEEGIAQLLFLESDQPCEISYKDKKGKYQSQQKITEAKI